MHSSQNACATPIPSERTPFDARDPEHPPLLVPQLFGREVLPRPRAQLLDLDDLTLDHPRLGAAAPYVLPEAAAHGEALDVVLVFGCGERLVDEAHEAKAAAGVRGALAEHDTYVVPLEGLAAHGLGRVYRDGLEGGHVRDEGGEDPRDGLNGGAGFLGVRDGQVEDSECRPGRRQGGEVVDGRSVVRVLPWFARADGRDADARGFQGGVVG